MAVEYKDYYKLLGVSRQATKDEISKAFKKLARKYHPDMNQGDKTAESNFKDINEAHEVLKDDEKRRLYDQLGPNWKDGQQFDSRNFGRQAGQGFGGGGFNYNFGGRGGAQSFDGSAFSDFFETLFGGGGMRGPGAAQGNDPFASFNRQPRKGRDVEAAVHLTLEDAYHGGAKSISLQTPSGVRTLEVKIPSGVKSGARIRLAGQGDAGQGQGAQPGDLFLAVSLMPHPLFSLDDNDVIYELPIAPWEAVLGAKVRVPTLDGEVDLTIPPGSGSQRKFRLRGRGLGSGTSTGDQFVRLAMAVPASLTPEEKELWKKLQDISSFSPR